MRGRDHWIDAVVQQDPARDRAAGAADHAAAGARLIAVRSDSSRAASGHVAKSKTKPLCGRLPGTTRRLLRTSSVSVRMKNAPISSIQFVGAIPKGTRSASRIARMNSVYGSGFGEATF